MQRESNVQHKTAVAPISGASIPGSARASGLIRREFPLEIKTILEAKEEGGDSDIGEFTAIASVFDVIDLHGDIIDRGAFDNTLAQKGAHRPLLWQHLPSVPIGLAKLRTNETGLIIDPGTPNGEVRQAREGMALVKQKAINGISIGFNIVRDAAGGRTSI